MRYGIQHLTKTSMAVSAFALCSALLIAILLIDFFHPRELLLALKHRLPWTSAVIAWETATPESQGMDRLKLDTLREDLAERNTRALLIVRNNKVVYEWYGQDSGPTERHGSASLAKGLVGGMALLVALTDGRINLDDPAWRYIPTWKDDPLKSRITIRHLATHSSGLKNDTDDVEAESHDKDDEWKKRYRSNRSERFSIAISQASVSQTPGSQLAYSNPGFEALAYAVTMSLNGTPQPDIYSLLKRRIMDPLGIPEGAWQISFGESYRTDGVKLYLVASGGSYTARAAARVGQLMLYRGNWEGRPLVDESAIEAISNVAPPVMHQPADHPAPGLGWWTNADGVWPALPRHAFVGAGSRHQLMLVVPSLDLVVVRFGESLGDTSPRALGGEYWNDAYKHLFKPLMNAVIPPPSSHATQ